MTDNCDLRTAKEGGSLTFSVPITREEDVYKRME